MQQTGILVFLLLYSTGCEEEHCLDCFKSTGPIREESRPCGDFREIRLSDAINLYLTDDSTKSLVVEAGEHLLSGIVTETEDGVLTIRDENRCNWVRSFKKEINVYVNVNRLRNIVYDGAGKVMSLNVLETDTMEMNFWDGSGKIELSVDCLELRVHQHTGCGDAAVTGQSNTAYFYSRGNGQVFCRGLVARDIIMDMKGTGDAQVCATHQLKARIGYIGNVYYWGKPTEVVTECTERGLAVPME